MLNISNILYIIYLLQSLMNPSATQTYDNDNTHRNERDKKRYKYCCRKCKHTEKGKKSCVCVVPLTQRRTSLTEIGCQTCKCKGCSIEDYISRGQDPEYKPTQRERSQNRHAQKDLCCKKCASSRMHKRCICQLPKNRRKNKLPPKGCKFCGCLGCNPNSYSPSKSKSSESIQRVYDEMEYNLNNIDRSVLSRIIMVEYSMNPALLGLGIPQRTPSYILGRPL